MQVVFLNDARHRESLVTGFLVYNHSCLAACAGRRTVRDNKKREISLDLKTLHHVNSISIIYRLHSQGLSSSERLSLQRFVLEAESS